MNGEYRLENTQYIIQCIYVNVLCMMLIIGKRERIDFSQTVTKYDRRFKVSSTHCIYHQDTTR